MGGGIYFFKILIGVKTVRTTVQERILSNKDHSPQHITLGGLRPQHIPNILFKNAQTGGGMGMGVGSLMFYALCSNNLFFSF